jgi:leucyl aminopeptidase
MATLYGRTDVSVRLFNHVNTNMPSVIMTIEGAEFPDEIVVVGGHLDSTSFNNNDAPGADDDASGIATMTESVRALFELGFMPNRTIELMAYAAEEIGLVGSAEIAQEYANNNVDVVSAVQFDMTNYSGSAIDVSFISDYTSATLNSFLMSLIDHYNATGVHQIFYGTSLCNYGCSDHASWTSEGYMSSFPFEATFGQHNPNIHTPDDTFSVSGTADHAAKFSKLCAEYLIEVAKSSTLSVDDVLVSTVSVFTQNGQLIYNLENAKKDFKSVSIFNMQGKKVFETQIASKKGSISTQSFSTGVYVATFKVDERTSVSKKILIK